MPAQMCIMLTMTAFLFAAIHRKLQTLRCLLSNRDQVSKNNHWLESASSVTARDTYPTPLIVEALKASGHLELRNENGLTPLQLASKTGNSMVVKMLPDHGAAIEAIDKYGWTSLYTAVYNGHNAIVEVLLQAEANVCAATKKWPTRWGRPSGLSQDEEWRGHALHIAAMFGRREIVKKLLHYGADVNANTGCREKCDWYWSGHGPSALHIALDTGTHYDRVGKPLDCDRLCIAQMLVDREANVNTVTGSLELDDIVRFEGFEELWEKLSRNIGEGEGVTNLYV
jgi:ankyrin repeat protein